MKLFSMPPYGFKNMHLFPINYGTGSLSGFYFCPFWASVTLTLHETQIEVSHISQKSLAIQEIDMWHIICIRNRGKRD
jgi:hypothetical protein